MIDDVYFLFAMLPMIVMNGVAAYRHNFAVDLLLALFFFYVILRCIAVYQNFTGNYGDTRCLCPLH